VVVPIRKGGVFDKGTAHHEQARIRARICTDKKMGGVCWKAAHHEQART